MISLLSFRRCCHVALMPTAAMLAHYAALLLVLRRRHYYYCCLFRLFCRVIVDFSFTAFAD